MKTTPRHRDIAVVHSSISGGILAAMAWWWRIIGVFIIVIICNMRSLSLEIMMGVDLGGLTLALVTSGRYDQGASASGNTSHEHSYQRDSNI